MVQRAIPEMGPEVFSAVAEEGGHQAFVRTSGQRDELPSGRHVQAGDRILAYHCQMRTFQGGKKVLSIQDWNFAEVVADVDAELQKEKEANDALKPKPASKPWLDIPKNPDWFLLAYRKVGDSEASARDFYPTREEAVRLGQEQLRSLHPQGRIETFPAKTHPEIIYVALMETTDLIPMVMHEWSKEGRGPAVREHFTVSPTTRINAMRHFRAWAGSGTWP